MTVRVIIALVQNQDEINIVENAGAVVSTSNEMRSPFLWLAVIVALGVILPFVPSPSFALALSGAIASTVSFVAAVSLLAASATQWPRKTWLLVALTLVSLCVWAALQYIIEPQMMASIANAAKSSGHEPEIRQVVQIVTLKTAINTALMCAAILGGAVIARLINSPNMLGPVCAIVAMIDIWGVLFGGIVSQMLDKMPDVSKQAMASAPAVGAASHAAAFTITPVSMGAGDYLFLGLLFAALHLNGMNWRGALNLTAPLIALALLGIMLTPLPMLPGLLFIGLGVAIPNLKYFEYSREEKFALLYAGLFVLALTVGLYFGITSLLSEKPQNINNPEAKSAKI